MNCPTCGAHNEADAQFCAECGTPLQSTEIDTPISGEIIDMPTEPDNDATILSGADDLAAQIRAATAESEAAEAGTPEPVSEPEPPVETPPPLPPSQPETPAVEPPVQEFSGSAPLPAAPPSAKSGGSNKKLLIVGGVALAFALLCCCCALLIGGVLGSDPNMVEDILREISGLPLQLPLV